MASWYGYTGPESPSEYLEENIFPFLLPAMEETLRVAQRIERRRRFNPLDHLVAYLYTNNPNYPEREGTTLEEIPFVKEEWAVNPRPPLPLSATLNEEEAALIIQSFYRGYLVRRTPKALLFRAWQRGIRQEKKLAANTIKTFMKKVSSTRHPNRMDRLERQSVEVGRGEEEEEEEEGLLNDSLERPQGHTRHILEKTMTHKITVLQETIDEEYYEKVSVDSPQTSN